MADEGGGGCLVDIETKEDVNPRRNGEREHLRLSRCMSVMNGDEHITRMASWKRQQRCDRRRNNELEVRPFDRVISRVGC